MHSLYTHIEMAIHLTGHLVQPNSLENMYKTRNLDSSTANFDKLEPEQRKHLKEVAGYICDRI